MRCVYCESERVVKNGKNQASGQIIQTYCCTACGQRFNERSGTPMAKLRTAPETITLALKARSEGLGIRSRPPQWQWVILSDLLQCLNSYPLEGLSLSRLS
jgi:transposase-like protein